MLEKSVVEERERAAADLEKERAQHTEQMKEMEEAMEGKMKTALESYMKNEEAFKLKQQTILSALKKSVSMEQDDHMQRSLDSMEKGAKDAIIRQRKEADAEKRAAETATKKFDKMVEDIRAKWALEEEKRNASLEGRVRAECSIEVKGLKAELAVANKTAQEVQAKFAQLFEKASDDHHDGLKAFAEKSRKTYVLHVRAAASTCAASTCASMCGRAHVRPSTCAAEHMHMFDLAGSRGVRGVSPRQPPYGPISLQKDTPSLRSERTSFRRITSREHVRLRRHEGGSGGLPPTAPRWPDFSAEGHAIFAL
jgi:hypothetical protein